MACLLIARAISLILCCNWCPLTRTEELVRLPGCFLCYTPADDAPPVAPLPALTNGFVTFGSFNALAKQTPEVRRLAPAAYWVCLCACALADRCQRCGGGFRCLGAVDSTLL